MSNTLHVFYDSTHGLDESEMLHRGTAAARAVVPMAATTAATQVFFFGGKRGSGKTYAAGKLTEELLTHGVQVVVIDVVGNWWGLRVGDADEGFAGFEIPVIGGAHGDIPVLAEGGAAVARMLVETRSSAVLDLSGLRKGARQRFITDWAEEFFHLKKTNQRPVHVVLEEAHTVVPQKIQKGQERMFGALEDLVRLGRNYGIGISMLDQRPQSVNKEVLHQAEVLCAFQFTGAHERDAIKRWAEAKELPAGKEVFRDLSSLPRGRCILWSPEWLKFCGKVDVGPKITLDASATPGSAEILPATSDQTMARVDLGELHKAMQRAAKKEKPSATPEIPTATTQATGTPVALELNKANARLMQLQTEYETREALIDALRAERQHDLVIIWPLVRNAIERTITDLEKVSEIVRSRMTALFDNVVPHQVIPVSENPNPRYTFEVSASPRDPDARIVHGHGPGEKMSKLERAILVTLAQQGRPLRRSDILAFSGYARSGNTDKAFSAIVTNGWSIVGNFGSGRSDEYTLTGAGKTALGAWEELPKGKALYQHLLAKPTIAEVHRRILTAIWKYGSDGATRAEVLAAADYKRSGNTDKAFGHWIKRGYIKVQGNKLIASETLYDH